MLSFTLCFVMLVIVLRRWAGSAAVPAIEAGTPGTPGTPGMADPVSAVSEETVVSF